ncbi:MAG: hypothetical protein H2041_17975 [Phenylobacterium sp.]|uniref:hypothetical protein n=1 Tax=Phenylobacterium sp. TaxID=1871053 RepID=UPI0017CC10C3|nr:hypothetical protein [Phenylobacterium sp.]MBA4795551.1 hypothetical protein [Phenylobacterium sp.]
MERSQVHYEVFVKKTPAAGWTLEMATESRVQAIAVAEELIAERRVASARVTKETMDLETREFQTVTIQSFGLPDNIKTKKAPERNDPLCVTPQDLYTVHARERIGRLLDGWLARNKATPFELLHRADLVEKLEASGVELQHAIQKIAVPEAQARGLTVHEIMRTFQGLVERAIERLLGDARRGGLPDVDKEGFAAAAERVSHQPDRAYLLGAGVAASIAPARDWTDKVSRLLDLADAAPLAGPPRGLALQTIEQPLAEILGSAAGLEGLIGRDLDLGVRLAAMTRLAASTAVEALIRVEPSVAKIMPELSEPAMRLGRWLATEDFRAVRSAIARRVMKELNGPRRLKPGDADGEIDLLRGLAMALTAASAGDLVSPDDVQAAFANRSKMLVTGDFVEAYLGKGRTAVEEAEALVWLVENVIGGANKRQAARWLSAVVGSLQFEKDARSDSVSAAHRLLALAKLHRAVARGGLAVEDYKPIQLKIGDIGGLVEADAKVAQGLARANASPAHKLTLLLKLACGEAAPPGPAADRARIEALKLVRMDETRAELARSPERMAEVRDLIQAAGLAA